MPHAKTRPDFTNALGYLRRRRVVGAVLASSAARHAAAQESWPSRPVRMIAALPPGSGMDLVARALAPFLAARFGQPFLVENRPGAGGVIAAGAVAQSTDRHTLLLTINEPITTARATNPSLPFDPRRDFTPITMIHRVPFILGAAPDSPFHDLAGLIAAARERPEQLVYASIGVGSIGHLAVEEIAARHGVRLSHAPYRGFAEMTLDVAAGRLAFGVISMVNALPAAQDNRIRALAITAERRSRLLPGVPTMAEAGEPGAESYGWVALAAPAGFPAEMARALAETIRAALAEAAARANLDALGAEFVASSPEEFGRFLELETARWLPLIARLGIRAG